MADEPTDRSHGPLAGVRVLELGQLVAGPFAGTLLAYFGAEVIKVEPPGGDPIRGWREIDDSGTSLWWYSLGRNKRCITLDLRTEEGRDLARRLADRVDVLIENFRPGTMERWGLGPEVLRSTNPGLIYSRVSGYGQDGPYAARPGYASVGEAVGGLRHVTGFPDGPPVRSNLSLGDTLAALHATLGILLALYHRDRRPAGASQSANDGRGQVVDTAIYEAVFNMLEAVVPEYDRRGAVRGPSGSTISGVVPTNSYPTRDRKWVVIGANGESVYRRLMYAAGRGDLADDPRLADNQGRVRHQEELDAAIADWTRGLELDEVLSALDEARVPAGPIHSVADMFTDPHFQARGLFETVEAGGRDLRVGAIVPKLSDTPGATTWAGPALGADTRAVLRELLDLDGSTLDGLADRGVI
ncbi:MAG: CoA transferase [Acidobacteriota bacterium]